MTESTSDERRLPDGAAPYKSRLDQITALGAGAIVTVVDDPDDPAADGVSLELFIKEHPRGPDYVSDFVYSDPALPVTVYGVLLSSATGLVIGELELFRAQWGYFDDYGEYVGPDGDWRAKDDEEWDVSARSDVLARRPPFEGITGAPAPGHTRWPDPGMGARRDGQQRLARTGTHDARAVWHAHGRADAGPRRTSPGRTRADCSSSEPQARTPAAG